LAISAVYYGSSGMGEIEEREGGGGLRKVLIGRVVPHKRAGCLFLALDDDGLPIV